VVCLHKGHRYIDKSLSLEDSPCFTHNPVGIGNVFQNSLEQQAIESFVLKWQLMAVTSDIIIRADVQDDSLERGKDLLVCIALSPNQKDSGLRGQVVPEKLSDPSQTSIEGGTGGTKDAASDGLG
jgi:hypothetical protein